MQFTYLVNYIVQHDDNKYSIHTCETYTDKLINSLDMLGQVKQAIRREVEEFIINRNFEYNKIDIISYNLVGINLFKTPNKKPKFPALKHSIWIILHEKMYTFHFMIFLSFLYIFPANKHPAVFLTILTGWLFLWLTLRMWVKK